MSDIEMAWHSKSAEGLRNVRDFFDAIISDEESGGLSSVLVG